MDSLSSIDSITSEFQKRGFTAGFKLRFDKLVTEDGKQYGTADFDLIESVKIEEDETNTRLFAVLTSDQTSGLMIESFGPGTDPISIDMIEKLQLPNLSRK